MKLHYKCNTSLPPLVWLASVNGGITEVIHGEQVECRSDFFVDGAWNEDFEMGNFINADWFCGTGAKICGDKIVFSTPSHVIGGLYVCNHRGGVIVSNSLCFLLAHQNLFPDNQYLNYEVDFNSILNGLHQYKREIEFVTNDGVKTSIRILYFQNLEVDSNNNWCETIKCKTKPFVDFTDYYTRLENAVMALCENGKADTRQHKYNLVTTISKGYDAPCCAVLAKKAGCNTAVTFKGEKYNDDCGSEIASLLGYSNIIEKDANEYLRRDDLIEAYYIVYGELGAQISFSTFDKEFKGNIVFFGDRGDSIWGKHADNRNNDFSFDDILSHLGNVERRLWLGSVFLPLPLYGATAWESIYDLSNSDEMRFWSVEKEYDRPIPRRIIEEAGVPRTCFGVNKHGAGFTYRYDWLKRIVKRMSFATGVDFSAFVKANFKMHLLQRIKFFWKTKEVYLSAFGIRCKTKQLVEYSKIANPLAARYLFPWATRYVTNKYKNILEKEFI